MYLNLHFFSIIRRDITTLLKSLIVLVQRIKRLERSLGHAQCTVSGLFRGATQVSLSGEVALAPSARAALLSSIQPVQATPCLRPKRAAPIHRGVSPYSHDEDVIVVKHSSVSAPTKNTRHNPSWTWKAQEVAEPDDVIDLGAPRAQPIRSSSTAPPRCASTAYTPNPRLYPGPKRDKRAGGEARRRRPKRSFRRVVPNSRLYRPAPPRPPPPPATPRACCPAPAPGARLDTASREALRVSEQHHDQRNPHLSCCYCSPTRESVPRTPRLVVTLPTASTPCYHPTSDHFRLRSLNTESGESTPVAGRTKPRPTAPKMEAGNRTSTSQDSSDGNDTLSAPSEFLAEFLSVIMRRQYAEALKYCRLILQYEPHNATARGFLPLLQHKVQHKRHKEPQPRGSSSEEASYSPQKPTSVPAPHNHELMEEGGDSVHGSDAEGDASCGSQSSLELDSSEAAQSSASASWRTSSASASAAGCSSAGGSRSDADDNGNVVASLHAAAADVMNDNAAEASGAPRHKSESSSSLRRLRAQFTCSIK